MKYYCNFKYWFPILIYFKYNLCDAALNIHQPLLQCSVSHDPSEIILICWFIISVEIVVLLNIFFGNLWFLFFESLINKKYRILYFLTICLYYHYLSIYHPCCVKVFNSFVYCNNVLYYFFIYQIILKKVSQVPKNIKQHNCFQHWLYIRMISEESCDTEDWSNDAENSALLHRNKLYF